MVLIWIISSAAQIYHIGFLESRHCDLAGQTGLVWSTTVSSMELLWQTICNQRWSTSRWCELWNWGNQTWLLTIFLFFINLLIYGLPNHMSHCRWRQGKAKPIKWSLLGAVFTVWERYFLNNYVMYFVKRAQSMDNLFVLSQEDVGHLCSVIPAVEELLIHGVGNTRLEIRKFF